MVVQLERQPGQKEPRWMQLLEADAEGRAAAAAAAGPDGPSARSSSAGAARVDPDRVAQLEGRVAQLEATVALLLGELGLEAPSPETASQPGDDEVSTQSPS
jgi:uncharacterized protein YceH (UPF0502 family)